MQILTARAIRVAVACLAAVLLLACVQADSTPGGSVVNATALAQSPKWSAFRDRLRDGGEGPEMVVLPTGSFRMGDLSGRGDADEKPVRTVTISRPIAMGKYEVTFEDYDRFALATGAKKPDAKGWGRGNRPVINVSWHDARDYAVWLSEQTGKRYRLPSEAEWEYATRAGTTMEYSWGNTAGSGNANCDGCGSRWDNDGTAPVGSFGASDFGLHDMHGNVWEWVEDCWHGSYQGAPPDGTAWTTGGDCAKRGLRGGSWVDSPPRLRAAFRLRCTPTDRYSDTGFRLVQDLTP